MRRGALSPYVATIMIALLLVAVIPPVAKFIQSRIQINNYENIELSIYYCGGVLSIYNEDDIYAVIHITTIYANGTETHEVVNLPSAELYEDEKPDAVRIYIYGVNLESRIITNQCR